MTEMREHPDPEADAEPTRAPLPDTAVNILLVDDNEANLQALEALLATPDWNLRRARSGEEALREVLDHEFAAILLDVMMPVMDGFETARLIRQREKSAHIPILFLTAVAKDKRYEELGYQAGAVDYLTKPVDEFALKSKLAVFADLFRVKEALRRETTEHARLEAEAGVELKRQQESSAREQAVLSRVSLRPNTSITSGLHGHRPIREAMPEEFPGLVKLYRELLDLAVDARVHETEHDKSKDVRNLASRMAFLRAGARDVVDVHTTAVAGACEERPKAKVRVITEEARFLLVELMGDLLAIYRPYFG